MLKTLHLERSTGDRSHHENHDLERSWSRLTSYSRTHIIQKSARGLTSRAQNNRRNTGKITQRRTPGAAASSLSAAATTSPNAATAPPASAARRLRRLPPGRACVPGDDACLRLHGLALLLTLLGLLPQPLEHHVRHPRVRRSLEASAASSTWHPRRAFREQQQAARSRAFPHTGASSVYCSRVRFRSACAGWSTKGVHVRNWSSK